MLSERSLLLACGGGFNSIEKQLRGSGAKLVVGPSTTAAAAAAFLYLEKVKNDKPSPHAITTATVSPLSSEIQIEFKDASMESSMIKNNNTNNTNQNIDHNSNNSNTNSLIINQAQNALSPNMLHKSNNQQSQQYQHQQLHSTSQQSQSIQKHPQQSILGCTANVKKERLSPITNGDLQSTISRSRSTTPSSFRGTSPHQISAETLMPLTSLLRIQQAASTDHQNPSVIAATMDTASLVSATAVLPTDYSTRNYSDIMRSLAAKYNDSNSTNPPSSRRNPFFDTTLSTQTTSAPNKNLKQQTVNRSMAATTPSTPLSKKDTQSHMMSQLSMSPGEVAVAAAAASFLSSLPFSQSVCPPLIDMSSTQALVTLARAAKEAEIHTILRSSQQNPKPLNSSPISPYPNLSVALQQAAQFVSPALTYSAQIQQQHDEAETSNQSSPLHIEKTVSTNSSGTAKKGKPPVATNATTVPLDLSSQPPSAKRLKMEAYDTGNSKEPDDSKISIKHAKTVDTVSLQISENNEFNGSSNIIQKVNTSRPNTPEKLSNIRLSDSPTPSVIRQSPVTRLCQAQSEEVAQWSVDDVCAFVGEIDICADYVQLVEYLVRTFTLQEKYHCVLGSFNAPKFSSTLSLATPLTSSNGMTATDAWKYRFRDQCIDGSGLPLLTEDHLLNSLGMKLGPALKLRSLLAKKLGGPCPCVACILQARQLLAFQAAVKSGTLMPAAATSTEPPTVPGSTKTIEEISDTINIADIHDKKTSRNNEEKESQQLGLNSNIDNSNSLTLQICANIYKNETNNNNHSNQKLTNENKKSIAQIPNKSCNNSIDCVLDPTINSIINEDCKNNNSAGSSNSAKNGSLQRTGSGDIADVGS